MNSVMWLVWHLALAWFGLAAVLVLIAIVLAWKTEEPEAVQHVHVDGASLDWIEPVARRERAGRN